MPIFNFPSSFLFSTFPSLVNWNQQPTTPYFDSGSSNVPSSILCDFSATWFHSEALSILLFLLRRKTLIGLFFSTSAAVSNSSQTLRNERYVACKHCNRNISLLGIAGLIYLQIFFLRITHPLCRIPGLSRFLSRQARLRLVTETSHLLE